MTTTLAAAAAFVVVVGGQAQAVDPVGQVVDAVSSAGEGVALTVDPFADSAGRVGDDVTALLLDLARQAGDRVAFGDLLVREAERAGDRVTALLLDAARRAGDGVAFGELVVEQAEAAGAAVVAQLVEAAAEAGEGVSGSPAPQFQEQAEQVGKEVVLALKQKGLVGDGTVPVAARLRAPVVGYIQIAFARSQVEGRVPTYELFGALATSTWTCSDNGAAYLASPGTPFRVTCRPVPSTRLVWRCDVLHADAIGMSVGARVRTSMDCDGTTPPEAQTRTITDFGWDSIFTPSAVLVTEFSCTVDDGAGHAALPNYSGGCGDPGVPTAEVG